MKTTYTTNYAAKRMAGLGTAPCISLKVNLSQKTHSANTTFAIRPTRDSKSGNLSSISLLTL